MSRFRTIIGVGKEVGFAKYTDVELYCFKSVRKGHRIRHYGLLANGGRAENIAKARALLAVSPSAEADSAAEEKAEPDGPRVLPRPCPHCGGRMIVIEVFARGAMPKYRLPVAAPVWIDTS